MTWPDFLLIGIWISMAALGARLGSLWTAACLAAGFLAALAVDYYGLPVASFIGETKFSYIVAVVALYLGVLAIILLPGYLSSRISSALLLGMFDSFFGLLTGAIAGVILITLALFLLVPLFPGIEKTRSWKNSDIAKPLHESLEEAFNNPRFKPVFLGRSIKKEMSKLAPLTKEAKEKASDLADRFVDKVKK